MREGGDPRCPEPSASKKVPDVPITEDRMPRQTAAPITLVYVECDLPEGCTLDEWRRRPRADGAGRKHRRLPRPSLRRSRRAAPA